MPEDSGPKKKFGERAVDLGFCSQDQVEQALDKQKNLARKKKPHRLTGLILLDKGAITNDQLIEVLRSYEAEGKGGE